MVKKIFIGVIIGALITPLSSIVCFIVAWILDLGPVTFSEALGTGIVVGIPGVFYSAIALLVYATPIYIILNKVGFVNILSFTIIALLPAAAIAAVMLVDNAFDREGVKFVSMIAWFSISSGYCFWWSVKEKRD